MEGIYHCTVCNGNASRKVYVGIYPIDEGLIQIYGNVTFVLDSNPNEATPQFRLCCTSTGGPATSVTWSRDSETLSKGTETVLNDATTAQYTHTLTVTGKLEGLYACSVANEISNDSARLNVTAPSPPSDVKLSQNGLRSVLVSWTSGVPAVTGYVVYYQEQNGEQNGSVTAEGSESAANITGLNPGTNYSIEIVATSSTLPSDPTLKHITIEQASISLYATPSYLVEVGHNVTLTCSVSLPKDVAGTPVYDWEGPADNFDPALFECDEDPCRSITTLY
ncbi:Down syndrome cell adhesion molecule homolog, partial [Geodia barretti]